MNRVAGIAAALVVLAVVGISVGRGMLRRGESPVIGDMRAIASSQHAYTSVNGGFHDRLECLAKPASCLPDYDGPRFLDDRLATLPDRDGYARRFYPGPPAAPEEAAPAASPTSITSWAMLAVPFGSDGEGPMRSYCVDDTGVIRFALDPTIPTLLEGRCPEDWSPLQ